MITPYTVNPSLAPYGTQANFHKEPPALRPPKVPMKAAMGLGFRD